MYENYCWPGVNDFKLGLGLWSMWLKEKFDDLVFKIYQYEARLN